jgi:hypothetical protein
MEERTMSNNRGNNETGPIRVVDCQNVFIIPCLEEAHRLLKMLGVRYTGFGNYEAGGFVFVRTGEHTSEFIGSPDVKAKFKGTGINGKGYTCFRALEEFREVFPHIPIKLLRAA